MLVEKDVKVVENIARDHHRIRARALKDTNRRAVLA